MEQEGLSGQVVSLAHQFLPMEWIEIIAGGTENNSFPPESYGFLPKTNSGSVALKYPLRYA